MRAVQRKRDSERKRHVVDAVWERVELVLAEMERRPRAMEKRMTRRSFVEEEEPVGGW